MSLRFVRQLRLRQPTSPSIYGLLTSTCGARFGYFDLSNNVWICEDCFLSLAARALMSFFCRRGQWQSQSQTSSLKGRFN